MNSHESFYSAGLVIDGTGRASKNVCIQTIGDRFGEIGTVAPADREVFDARAWTVIPGLIDVHVHLLDCLSTKSPEQMEEFMANVLQNRLMAFLRHGITTIKSCGDAEDEIFDIRDRVDAGDLLGPRVLIVGPGLTSINGHPASTIYGANPWYRPRAAVEIGSEADAKAVVSRLAERGVDGIKLLVQGGCDGEAPYIQHVRSRNVDVPLQRLERSLIRAAVDEAHKHNLGVTVHTLEQARARESVESGADSLEHGVTKEDISDPELIALLRSKKTTIAPTLAIYNCLQSAMQNMKLLHEGDVGLAMGTDTYQLRTDWGLLSISEIKAMAQAGLTAEQALMAATIGAAAHIKREHDLGSIEKGKLADFVIVDGNPHSDLDALDRIVVVVRGGKVVVDNRT